jgi:thioredoxin-dependent peroxiredoxin
MTNTEDWMASSRKTKATKPGAPHAPKSAGKTKAGESAALEGKKAPAFSLPDSAGIKVRLADLIGAKTLVLYFYPKDMTPGCTTEACSFRDNSNALRAAGAQVVGVSGDSPESHTKFSSRYELNFPLLSDADHKVGRAYGVYKKKSLYGREFMGIERTTFIVDRAGVIRKVFPKVKVAGHTEQVLAALREIR